MNTHDDTEVTQILIRVAEYFIRSTDEENDPLEDFNGVYFS